MEFIAPLQIHQPVISLKLYGNSCMALSLLTNPAHYAGFETGLQRCFDYKELELLNVAETSDELL